MKKSERYRQDVHYVIDKVKLPISNEGRLREEAKGVYDEFHDSVQTSLVGQFEEELFARASIYLASQRLYTPISIDEMGDSDQIAEYAKRMRKYGGINTLPTPAEEFVKRYAEEMMVDEEIEEKAVELAESYISSKRPKTIAAAALYASSLSYGTRITQARLSSEIGVTEVSIRNCYQDMQEKIEVFA